MNIKSYLLYEDNNPLFLKYLSKEQEKHTINLIGNTSQEGTPTPDNPVDINVVTGNNSITISNGVKTETYPISLGNIELGKIENYKDKIYNSNDKWYLEKNIGKVVLNGSENWIYYASASTSVFYIMPEYSGIYYKQKANLSCYCDYYKGKGQVATFDDVYNLGNNVIAFRTTFTRLVIRDDRFNNIGDFKAELSTNNTTLYYVLATPTDTQITDTTLVNQLEALYTASIHAITHINTETSNLLPYIDLKYNVVTASPSPERASEVEVVKGNNTITISNEDGTKTQSYNLTLGNLELCKIGDYQDYFYKDNGNWYKHSEVGKVVFDGTEYWEGGSSATVSTNYTYVYTQVIDSLAKTGVYTCFNNKLDTLNGPMLADTSVSTDTLSCGSSGYNRVRIMILTSRLSSANVNGFKSWLSNNNVTLYYVLTTPTTTQITDQLLVSQLDELQKAMSYYDKTLITQTNADKPFILDVIGIRDLQDIFNI